MIVFVVLNAVFSPHDRSHPAAGKTGISIKTPQGTVTIDAEKMERSGKDMEAWAKKMEAATKNMEASAKIGDIEATGKAVNGLLSAMTGTAERATLSGEQIKAFLPERLADLERTSFETDGVAVAGIQAGSGKATYGSGKRSIRLEIVDASVLGPLGALAGRMQTGGEKVDERSTEKTIRQGKRTVQESARKDGSTASYKVMLANGIAVNTEAHGMTLDDLKKALEAVDLQALEQVK
jgi:hypothetical protein